MSTLSLRFQHAASRLLTRLDFAGLLAGVRTAHGGTAGLCRYAWGLGELGHGGRRVDLFGEARGPGGGSCGDGKEPGGREGAPP